jgi:YidC/Oxa1 family membrane protein insertase
MAASPLQLFSLSQHIYPFLPNITNLIPLKNHFLWLNLGLPDPYFLLPLVVVATTWVQSKVMTPPTASADPQAAQMSQTMSIYMPLMIGWMSLNFPSGLSIYWVISNIVGIVQYALTTPINWKNVFTFNFNLFGPAEPPKVEKSKKKKPRTAP